MKKVLKNLLLLVLFLTLVLSGCRQKEEPQTEEPKEDAAVTEEKKEETDATEDKEEKPAEEEADKAETGTEEPVEITIAFWNVQEALSGGENDALLQEFQKRTGVKLVPQDMSSTDYHEKVQLWATNGQLPDIFVGDFVGLGQSSFFDWVEQGIIRALPDDLSPYPNLEKYMEMERAKEAMQNGKHYIIPRQSYGDITYSVLDRNIAYRWDLAQEAGVIEEPKNWDEFRDMLRKIIAADPEGKSIGGMCQSGVKSLAGIMYPYGGILEKKWIINDEGVAMPSVFDGDIKAVMKLAQDMYREGTIIKDLPNLFGASANEAFLQGKVAALGFNNGPASLFVMGRDYEELYPDRKFLDDVKIAPIFPGADGQNWYFVDTEAWSETYFNSNLSDEKMDAILKMFDYLVTDEGKILMFCGLEGEDYDVVDGKIVKKEGLVLSEKYPFALMENLAVHNPERWREDFPSTAPDEYRALNKSRHEDAVNNGVLPKITDATMLISTPLKDQFYYNPHDDFYAIMMGTEDSDKMVDDLLAEYKSKGLDEMIEEVNKAAKERGILD